MSEDPFLMAHEESCLKQVRIINSVCEGRVTLDCSYLTGAFFEQHNIVHFCCLLSQKQSVVLVIQYYLPSRFGLQSPEKCQHRSDNLLVISDCDRVDLLAMARINPGTIWTRSFCGTPI